jgi:hypothetical protein
MHKLVYTDENDLRTYESLPEKDFKEFFMAYFKYNKGDKIDVTDFTNPITFALFNSYIPKLDKNEDTYNKKVNANRENGKKGGRPKKSVLLEVTSTEFDLPKPDENAENENKADLSHFNPQDDNQYQTEGQMPSNGLKIAKEEDINEIPCTEQEVEYDNYEEVVYDVLESEDGDIIRNILDRSIDYQYFDKTEYEYAYTNGDNHIKEIISKYDFTPKAHKDFETYCIKHSTSYYNYEQEKLSMNYSMTA